MRSLRTLLLLLVTFAALAPGAASADVVINEIFYNAPDDIDDLQWVEFHNASDRAADLSGWTLDDGKIFTFPSNTTLAANGYLVAALSPDRFTQFYQDRAVGPFKRPLKRGGEKIELKDVAGKVVDVARYKDRAPWPVSADGYSASLERICPSVSGDAADNWAGSPLPPTPKPSGTPGKQNASFSETLPPVVTIAAAPTGVAPGTPLRVEATANGVKELTLRYRVVAGGTEGEEAALPMAKEADGRFAASIPGQATGALVRYRVKAVGENSSTRFAPAEHDLRPTLSAYVHDKWEPSNIPLGLIIRGGSDKPSANQAPPAQPRFGPPGGGFPGMGGRGPRPNFGGFGPRQETPRPPRGASAFVFADQKTGKTTVFDHINTVPRNNDRGFKIFFHKDHTLDAMASVNLAFEGSEWSLMAEALAYDVYRRAGSPAPLAEFVRVWVDGKLAGHHLMIERPNKSFLRRNKIDDAGNLYKVLWTGRDVVSQHEKRTNEQGNHDDLLAVIDQLTRTANDPDAQWKVIQEEFDVEQVATYFAVNMVLSHWDGFFNNFFPYHDAERDKWMMFPWDQDKTWGYYDGLPDDQVFFDMPLTFGMEGDRPPAPPPGGARPGGPRRGAMWWRPGGYFSRPLLANPHFRKVFLSKTRDVLERIYTQETYVPLIDQLTVRLGADAAIRAKLRGEDEAAGAKLLARDTQLLKDHLTKRRQFLLEQQELAASAGAPKR
jgi:hypothetical protein